MSDDVLDLAERLQRALGDSYEVEDPLGRGGFAVVFRVRDADLKRLLAIKVLSPDVITSKSALERFRREAETVARLSHPNIVPLHFIGQKDDLLYIAMAYVDGGSVADQLRARGPLSIPEATRIMREVAGALAHAHKRGVVHRDIKPQNVLLDSESGRVLVTDFGIARTQELSSLTGTGIILGTPAYLAPEQITGEPSDHRADIYALGVMGYELLTGRPPFEGPSPAAVLMKRVAGAAEPLSKARPGVPAELEATIESCMAVDPEERVQTALDVVRVLNAETPTSSKTLPSPRGSRPFRSRSLLIGLAGASAIVIAVASRAFLRDVPATIEKPRVVSTDDEMRLIPAGDYLIGSDNGPPGAYHRPAHNVHLSAFRLGTHEVTVREYAAFVDSTHAQAPWGESRPRNESVSVTGVQFAEAARYCAWRHPAGGRLPTEEEWEAAARNSSSVGIPTLTGGVWEWTSSPLRAYPGGRPLPDSLLAFRVIRGGASNTPDSLATPWNRVPYPPAAPRAVLSSTGFRCAARS